MSRHNRHRARLAAASGGVEARVRAAETLRRERARIAAARAWAGSGRGWPAHLASRPGHTASSTAVARCRSCYLRYQRMVFFAFRVRRLACN